jgi:ADP-heptose:LPS heptosyltransferase
LKKILIIRFSSIGDIVLTTPVIRCIKEQLPGAEVHYLTKASFKGIVENNPHISKVFTITDHVSEVIADLQKEQYDHVVDLHHNLRSMQVKRLLGKPSTTFKKMNFQKWMMVNFKSKIFLPHIVERYLDAVSKLGVKNDGKGLDYFIPAADEVDIRTLPLSHQNGYIAFVIGAKHYTKQLPVEKIICICRKLHKPVILLGGKEDAARAAEIENALGGIICNTCGKYNLNQSASLVKQALRVITHDTGLMHIAAAFSKDITSVWGNTVPGFGFAPYLPAANSKIVEVNGLPCRPCSKIGYEKCPRGHFKCMREINENLF